MVQACKRETHMSMKKRAIQQRPCFALFIYSIYLLSLQARAVDRKCRVVSTLKILWSRLLIKMKFQNNNSKLFFSPGVARPHPYNCAVASGCGSYWLKLGFWKLGGMNWLKVWCYDKS